MRENTTRWLADTQWLADHLDAPDIAILDASYTPAEGFPLDFAYQQRHIPGARFFDIDAIADTSNPLPHMLPSPEKFASMMRRMGIGDGNRVVVYDDRGIISAARAWWMFRVMGHDDVAVLDGGLPKWLAEGRPVEALAPRPPTERHFTARWRGELVRDFDDMKRLSAESAQIIDARSAERFAGKAPEPREVPRAGHIPNSINLPYPAMFKADGTMRGADELRALFSSIGVDLGKPIATTCGSGVTACIIALGLALAGHENAAVYDGSWSEWSTREEAPIDT
jgi:thiosulfate/3-mercaptopyruvate sulfurtransferase